MARVIWKKNWLTLALVSVLSMSLGMSAEAATRKAQSTTSTDQGKSSTKSKAKSKPKAGAAKERVSARGSRSDVKRDKVASSRKTQQVAHARSSARKAEAHAKASRHSEPAVAAREVPLKPVVMRANLPARSAVGLSNMAAASSASGASFGQLYGLHHTPDPLDLKSSVAFVMDQDTNEVVFDKNSNAVLPIASLTKLMTATVIVEANLPLDESITVTSEDVDTEKNSSSRLAVGSTMTRGEALHLALMSSENRAAHALGRTYPGGLPAFVAAMNAKARAVGMRDTRYVDPTGLSSRNQSSARDLAALVRVAYQQPLIRELSTSPEYAVRLGARQVQFRNTNSLVRNPSWDIGLQKTGYIVEAGRCLVMQARMAGRKFIMVFLDSTGKYSRQADAERVRRWIEGAAHKGTVSQVPALPKITS